jgi:hypothetical protein
MPLWRRDGGQPVDRGSASKIRDFGWVAQTVDREALGSLQALVDGVAQLTTIHLVAGDVVNGITVSNNANGSSLTLVKVGLYSFIANPARLAVSADEKAQFTSGGLKDCAVTAAYTVVSTGLYYIAVVAKGTGTFPAMKRAVNDTNVMAKKPGSSLPEPTPFKASLTDLPDPLGAPSAGGLAFWAAVY